jgi:hypothetical protein
MIEFALLGLGALIDELAILVRGVEDRSRPSRRRGVTGRAPRPHAGQQFAPAWRKRERFLPRSERRWRR